MNIFNAFLTLSFLVTCQVILENIWCFLSLQHKRILYQRCLHCLLRSKYVCCPTNDNLLFLIFSYIIQSYVYGRLAQLNFVFKFASGVIHGRVRYVTVILNSVLSPHLFENNYRGLILSSIKCLDHYIVASVDVGSTLVHIGS